MKRLQIQAVKGGLKPPLKPPLKPLSTVQTSTTQIKSFIHEGGCLNLGGKSTEQFRPEQTPEVGSNDMPNTSSAERSPKSDQWPAFDLRPPIPTHH